MNARAIALADSIAARRLEGVRDVVPTYRSVTVYFDPLRVDYETLLAHLESESDRAGVAGARSAARVQIPVCYGGEDGPDLPEVAAFARISEDEVVRLHTSVTYRVFMLGFGQLGPEYGRHDHLIGARERPREVSLKHPPA